MQWPLDHPPVAFNDYYRRTLGSDAPHHGGNTSIGWAIDLPAPAGTPRRVVAHRDATEIHMGDSGWWGTCGLGCEYFYTRSNGDLYRIRLCHAIAHSVFPAMLTPLSIGDMVGQVGSTGLSTGPHVHLVVWLNGWRIKPEDWLIEINAEEDDSMTPGQQRLHDIGAALMASVGNPDRPDLTVGWHLVEVTTGIGNWLTSPGTATRAKRRSYGQQLRDVASATEAVIRTGEG